jgi:hypothetical protein
MCPEPENHRILGVHDDALPYLFQAGPSPGPLAAWARDHAGLVEEKLHRHGAVLFRGFNVNTQEIFEEVAGTLAQGLVAEGGEHQRLRDDSQVYTPVAYPPDKFLMWHNEDSFNPEWPRKIMFCPVRVPARGGETPLVDAREVYARLGPEILAPFLDKGILYHRTYGMGVGRSWQDIFRTGDPAEVEAYCGRHGIEHEWRGQGLITRQRRSAVARHHGTGEMVWFAQAQHWHPACLDPETRSSLESLFDDDEMPRNCFYGDGSPIEDEVMERICDAYRELQACFPWEVGDVMLVDNVLAAHARNSYQGERKLLVALGELSGDYNL